MTIVQEAKGSTRNLFQFAYYLRLLDKNNLYTRRILKDEIKPDVLLDVIESSVWDSEKNCLVPDPNRKFRLLVG